MSYIYNREKPGCTCPRCRFAAANSQPRRVCAESEEKLEVEQKPNQAPSFTQLEKDAVAVNVKEANAKTANSLINAGSLINVSSQGTVKSPTPAKRPMADNDIFTSPAVEQAKKGADNGAVTTDSVCDIVADGSMESFDGSVPAGWSTETPALVSREDRRGQVHTGRYSVRLRDGAQLSFTTARISETGYTLSFFAKGGWRTGLSAVMYCVSGDGERECASITVEKGDLPRGRGQFGYYVLRTQSIPVGVQSVRVEFNVFAGWNGSVLLDDVALVHI
ncbi:MAG: hypothetical protein AB9835_03120 [Eubacteriales bacterium]